MPSPNQDFVKKLQQEASLQARLHTERLLPARLDPITAFIGRYSWQVILVLSALTALVVRISV